MSLERKRAKDELALKAYFPEYQQIVSDLLMAADTFEKLFVIFNEAFPGNSSITRKSLPSELRAGRVTCDTACLLVAIWWELTHQINTVVLAIQSCSRNIEPHRCIGLPTSVAVKLLSAPQDSHTLINSTYDTQIKERPTGKEPITWIHWKSTLKLNYLKYENRQEIDTPFSPHMRSSVLSPKALARLIISQSNPEKTKQLLKKLEAKQNK
ncbi:MAG TPA: hypothetical protein VF209_00420 [Patescibacteria group bacterium]